MAEIWSSIEPMQGREYLAAAQLQSGVNTRIRIRHRPGLNEKLRVVHVAEPGSPGLVEVYDVVAVVNVNKRDREAHLMCKAKGGEGFAYDGS